MSKKLSDLQTQLQAFIGQLVEVRYGDTVCIYGDLTSSDGACPWDWTVDTHGSFVTFRTCDIGSVVPIGGQLEIVLKRIGKVATKV